MSQKSAVNKDVCDLVSEIVSKYNFGENPTIKYNTGGQAGDGYLSNTVTVSISNAGKHTLELFVKYALSANAFEAIPFDKLYANEIHFYNQILPVYTAFLNEKKVKDGFRNVPKCYGTFNENTIALENLKCNGYVVYDRTQIMNDTHIEMVFRSLAKFHAISFALKDQDGEKYERLVEKAYNVFAHQDWDVAHRARTEAITELLETLDPVEDKYILDRCHDLPDRMIEFVKDNINIKSKYTILIQGDCWCNNMMFHYENDDEENPKDIVLIDWQMIRSTLPVYDLSFFFYSIATKESLDKVTYFMNIYHAELSEQLRKLGSDPDILYPYSVLEEHWKEHSKYGLVLGLLAIRLILTEPDETYSFEDMDTDSIMSLPKIRNYTEYLRRLKILVGHMVENEYI